MVKFFNIKSSRTWVNVRSIESIYRVRDKHTMRTMSGAEYPLTEEEYLDLVEIVRFEDKKPEEHEDKKD